MTKRKHILFFILLLPLAFGACEREIEQADRVEYLPMPVESPLQDDLEKFGSRNFRRWNYQSNSKAAGKMNRMMQAQENMNRQDGLRGSTSGRRTTSRSSGRR